MTHRLSFQTLIVKWLYKKPGNRPFLKGFPRKSAKSIQIVPLNAKRRVEMTHDSLSHDDSTQGVITEVFKEIGPRMTSPGYL